ncbi:MAG: right-handed parallel beta-helix repeat-containing protein [bacterium]
MKRVPSIVAALVAALTAEAQTISGVATFNNVGVDVVFASGPTNGTVIATAVKKVSDPGPYIPAHPLSRISTTRFSGSLFRLDPGTAYSIQLSSAAFAPTNKLLTISTWTNVFPDATNRILHVAPSGSDANSGLSFSNAFRTFARALTAAVAGDKVLVYDGRYYEGDFSFTRSGTASSPIVFQNAPGAKPVMDGTDTNFVPAWTLYDASTGIYRTATTRTPLNAYLNGGQLYRYSVLGNLVANTWNQTVGYHADGSFLYIRFPGGGAPGTNVVTIPRFTELMILSGSAVQIRGFEVCYYGYGLYHRGFYLEGADNVLVEDCAFHHNGVGVALKNAAHSNVIQRCTFNESPIDTFSWSAVKSGGTDYEAGGVHVYGSTLASMANVIRNNRFERMFDGAHLYSDDGAGPTRNMDFYSNIVAHCADDGIETDGAGSNCRIYDNAFSDFLTGISVAPCAVGPTYIFGNLLWGWHNADSYEGYPFKFNVSSALTIDWVYLYHNTCYSAVPGQDGFLFKSYSKWTNIISRNNIYAGTDYALENWSPVNPVSFDYDALYTTSAEQFVRWNGSIYLTVADFFAGTGQEQHGLKGDPQFMDSSATNFVLRSSSPLIDKAQVIPGVNDDYVGVGPDMGAFEFIQWSGGLSLAGTNLLTRWNVISGTAYRLQFSGELSTWTDVTSAVTATNSVIDLVGTNDVGAQGFYRTVLGP